MPKRVQPVLPERLEPRVVFDALSASAAVTLVDLDGTTIAVTMTGPGEGTADLVDGKVAIALAGTTRATTVAITPVGGGDGSAVLGRLDVDDLRALKAPAVHLVGGVHGAGLGDVSLASVQSSTVRADTVRSLKLAGALTDTRVVLHPGFDTVALGTLRVGGLMSDSHVDALGDVGRVTVGGMVGSGIFAGVRYARVTGRPAPFEQVLPTASHDDDAPLADFTGHYTICGVTVTGRATTGAGRHAFADSRVVAATVGRVRATGVDHDNGGRPFGVSAYRFGRVDVGGRTRGDLRVHQIYQPPVYDDDSGSYGGFHGYGLIVEFGGGGGTATSPPTVNPPVSQTVWQEPQFHLGDVTRHPTVRYVYGQFAGGYTARDAAGQAVAHATTLGEMIAYLVGETSGTSVKAVRQDADGTTTFRSTSVGPAATLRVGRYRVHHAQESATPDGWVWVANAVVPSLDELKAEVGAVGVPLDIFAQPLVMMPNETFRLGDRFDPGTGVTAVSIMSSGTFTDGAGVYDSLADALLGNLRVLGGSRRHAPRIETDEQTGTLAAYSLPNGGTAVLDKSGLLLLDARGAVHGVPALADIRAALATLL